MSEEVASSPNTSNPSMTQALQHKLLSYRDHMRPQDSPMCQISTCLSCTHAMTIDPSTDASELNDAPHGFQNQRNQAANTH